MKRVMWAVPMERSIQEYAVLALLQVAMHAGARGYAMLPMPYSRTDTARNRIVQRFLKETQNDSDTLIMLDADHAHPGDILERLAVHDVGVVGALAFRRGAPFDPCFLMQDGESGETIRPAYWEERLYEGLIVGTGAIAIQRWVFRALDEAGFRYPYFRYEYDGDTFATEDIYFGECCRKVGIPHYCDMTLITPHLTVSQIDASTWHGWLEAHRSQLKFIANNAPQIEPAWIGTRVDL